MKIFQHHLIKHELTSFRSFQLKVLNIPLQSSEISRKLTTTVSFTRVHTGLWSENPVHLWNLFLKERYWEETSVKAQSHLWHCRCREWNVIHLNHHLYDAVVLWEINKQVQFIIPDEPNIKRTQKHKRPLSPWVRKRKWWHVCPMSTKSGQKTAPIVTTQWQWTFTGCFYNLGRVKLRQLCCNTMTPVFARCHQRTMKTNDGRHEILVKEKQTKEHMKEQHH